MNDSNPNQLLQDAMQLLQAESYPAANAKALAAVEILKREGDSEMLVIALRLAGSCAGKLGDNATALEHYKEALSVARSSANRSSQQNQESEILILNDMGATYLDLDQPQAALDCFHRVVQIILDLGDMSTANQVGKMLSSIGYSLGNENKFDNSLAFYAAALQVFRATDNKEQQAVLLNNLGLTHSNLNQHQEALGFLNEALLVQRQIGDEYGECTTLNNIGLAYDGLGEQQKGLEFLKQSLEIANRGEWIPEKAQIIRSIATIYLDLGNYQKVLSTNEDLLPLQRVLKNLEGEAGCLNNIGLAYANLGRRDQALKFYQQALTIDEEIQDWKAGIITLNNIGKVHADLGDNFKAVEFYQKALIVSRTHQYKEHEAVILNNIARVHSERGDLAKALELLTAALPLAETGKDRSVEIKTLNNIAKTNADLGNPKLALDFYSRALVLSKALGTGADALVLCNIGTAHLALNELEEALTYLNLSLPVSRLIHDKQLEATILSNLTVAWHKLGKPDVAIFYGKESINLFQELRGFIQSLDQATQRNYLKTVEVSYRFVALELIGEHRFAEAQQVLNFYKDQRWLDTFHKKSESSPRLAFTKHEQKMFEQYEATGPFPIDAEIPHAADDRAVDVPDTREMQGALREIRQRTKMETVAVYTVLSQENFVSLLVTEETIGAASSRTDGVGLNNKAGLFWKLLQEPGLDPLPLAHELYSEIFAPLEEYLPKETKAILWSLDGNLRHIPMGALHDGKQYLIERFSHVVFTRADSERLTRKVSPSWSGVGFGSSSAHSLTVQGETIEFSPVLGVVDELEGIFKTPDKAEGICKGEILLDEEFTRDSMYAALSKDPQLVHIASHFCFMPGDESLSFLLLGDGKPLSLSEIKQHKDLFSGVELLTLSACETAAQQEASTGYEIDGFAELAQRLGAAAVLATLWAVADTSTSLLMREFYRGRELNGLNKASALRQAQLALLTSKTPFAHPYFWSPFILFGNWA